MTTSQRNRGRSDCLSYVLLALVLLAAVGRGQSIDHKTVEYSDKPWIEYKPSGGRFSVSLPAIPEERVQMVDTALGPLEMHSALLIIMRRHDFIVCGVMYNDLPRQITEPSAIAGVINGARDQVLSANSQRKLISEKELTLGSYKGRELTIEQPDLLIIARIFVVKERVFELITTTPRPQETNEGNEFADTVRQKFWLSFGLVPSDSH